MEIGNLFLHLYKQIGGECEISFSPTDSCPKIAYLLSKAPPNSNELYFRNTLIYSFFEKFLFNDSKFADTLKNEISQIYSVLGKYVIFNIGMNDSKEMIKFYIDFGSEIPYSERILLMKEALPGMNVQTELNITNGGLYCFGFDIYLVNHRFENKFYWLTDFDSYKYIFPSGMAHRMIVALETSNNRKKFYTKCNFQTINECEKNMPHFTNNIEKFCNKVDIPHLFSKEILLDTTIREELYFTHLI